MAGAKSAMEKKLNPIGGRSEVTAAMMADMNTKSDCEAVCKRWGEKLQLEAARIVDT